ncbi:hypothetical protein OHA77_34025 [Streptosporangium sp. NBC_01639]|uniref:hypothetical protein n=1 Tax=unclassified Streptosporangium TaxID=2632669 RepID=UPI002DDA5A2C|nr:hypothetical protein [Streptosporangium sp. NBC_01756]WSC87713.1 hypothetical protein OIE48_05735 [Streptosporangium sp. NBC_01756]WTD53608.1 hypothetical protein OHA77_34025 [Streptosporangium sp. NBC_01639]
MIAGPHGCASPRRRRAAPWLAVLVCLGLCLAWHPDVTGPSEGALVATVVSDGQPADEPPAEPVVRYGQSRRDPRAQARVSVIPRLSAVAQPAGGPPARSADAGELPAAPRAPADRLILLSVSRI